MVWEVRMLPTPALCSTLSVILSITIPSDWRILSFVTYLLPNGNTWVKLHCVSGQSFWGQRSLLWDRGSIAQRFIPKTTVPRKCLCLNCLHVEPNEWTWGLMRRGERRGGCTVEDTTLTVWLIQWRVLFCMALSSRHVISHWTYQHYSRAGPVDVSILSQWCGIYLVDADPKLLDRNEHCISPALFIYRNENLVALPPPAVYIEIALQEI